jgi:MFS family permease
MDARTGKRNRGKGVVAVPDRLSETHSSKRLYSRALIHKTTFTLGFLQIIGYGSSYYLLGVLAAPISSETHWPQSTVISGLSVALLVCGFASFGVGKFIDQRGGRHVLMAGSGGIALGLLILAYAPSLPVYFAGWVTIGLGMSGCLYDAVFASLGYWLGLEARRSISAVTLYGGLATIVSWPLSATLVEYIGWRGTCVVYALMHLFCVMPLLYFGTRNLSLRAHSRVSNTEPRKEGRRGARALIAVLVGLTLTIAGMITAAMGINVIRVLGDLGASTTAAVLIGSLIGPTQIVARIIDLAMSRFSHPLLSAFISAALITIGLLILMGRSFPLELAVITYAAGAGLTFVIKGTLPLSLFGADGYAALVGRIAVPTLVMQALSPYFSSLIISMWNSAALIAVLSGFGGIFFGLVGAIFLLQRTAQR